MFLLLIFIVSCLTENKKIRNDFENDIEEVFTDKNYKDTIPTENGLRKLAIEVKTKNLLQQTKYNSLENYQETLIQVNKKLLQKLYL